MAYLTSADITDSIVESIDLTAYLARADKEIEALALSKGVQAASISTPLHYIISRWAAAWVVWIVCLEKSGKVNINQANPDKYAAKRDAYATIANQYLAQINKEMFYNAVNSSLGAMPTGMQLVRSS